jgi:hypothetical protein
MSTSECRPSQSPVDSAAPVGNRPGAAALTRGVDALIRLVLLVCATGLAALTAAAAAPSTSLREVLDALGRCWQAPAGTVGSEMTLALSLNRSGEIQGSPRITYSHLPGMS